MRLNVISAILFSLCIFVGSGLYYFYHEHEWLDGVSCEADAKFTYMSSADVDSENYPEKIHFDLRMNYIFFSGNSGVLTLTGIASSGDKRFFVSRDITFNYLVHDGFYEFTYKDQKLSVKDTLPSEVYNYLISRDVNFYRIRHVDRETLMFSNMYSPVLMCNINI